MDPELLKLLDRMTASAMATPRLVFSLLDDGEGEGGDGAGGGEGGGASWTDSIEDADLKTALGKYESQDSLFKAIGYEKPAAPADWRDGLTTDEAKTFAKNSPDIEHLIGRALEMRQKLSTAVIPPGKDASEEQVAAYRKQIGVPDSSDKYQFAMPEGAEPTDVDKAFQSAIAEVMYAHNIPASSAKALSEVYNNFTTKIMQEQVAADKQYAEQSEAELRKAWPGAEYDKNKEFANRAFAKVMSGDDLEEAKHLETKDGRFIMDHPIMLRAFAAVGREMAEGGLVPPLTEGDISAVNDEINATQKKIDEAQAAGNSKEANRLYQQKMGLIAKRDGNQNIVGTAGRAA